MNGPRIGERYQRCAHAADGGQHFWRSKSGWIGLCAACHKLFAARKPVALVWAVRATSVQLSRSKTQ
jgi:hypothetical protein